MRRTHRIAKLWRLYSNSALAKFLFFDSSNMTRRTRTTFSLGCSLNWDHILSDEPTDGCPLNCEHGQPDKHKHFDALFIMRFHSKLQRPNFNILICDAIRRHGDSKQ